MLSGTSCSRYRGGVSHRLAHKVTRCSIQVHRSDFALSTSPTSAGASLGINKRSSAAPDELLVSYDGSMCMPRYITNSIAAYSIDGVFPFLDNKVLDVQNMLERFSACYSVMLVQTAQDLDTGQLGIIFWTPFNFCSATAQQGPPWPPPIQLGMRSTNIQLRPVTWPSFCWQRVVRLVQSWSMISGLIVGIKCRNVSNIHTLSVWEYSVEEHHVNLLPMVFGNSATEVQVLGFCLMNIQFKALWPPPVRLEPANSDADPQPLPWSSFYLAEGFNTGWCFSFPRNQLWPPPIRQNSSSLTSLLIMMMCDGSAMQPIPLLFFDCYHFGVPCGCAKSGHTRVCKWDCQRSMAGFVQWYSVNVPFGRCNFNIGMPYLLWIQWEIPWFIPLLVFWSADALVQQQGCGQWWLSCRVSGFFVRSNSVLTTEPTNVLLHEGTVSEAIHIDLRSWLESNLILCAIPVLLSCQVVIILVLNDFSSLSCGADNNWPEISSFLDDGSENKATDNYKLDPSKCAVLWLPECCDCGAVSIPGQWMLVVIIHELFSSNTTWLVTMILFLNAMIGELPMFQIIWSSYSPCQRWMVKSPLIWNC